MAHTVTSCELCRRAELTPLQRLGEDLLSIVGLGRRPTAAEIMAHSFASSLRTLTGGAVTAYERHREAYEKTGDPLELQRMLRHVK